MDNEEEVEILIRKTWAGYLKAYRCDNVDEETLIIHQSGIDQFMAETGFTSYNRFDFQCSRRVFKKIPLKLWKKYLP